MTIIITIHLFKNATVCSWKMVNTCNELQLLGRIKKCLITPKMVNSFQRILAQIIDSLITLFECLNNSAEFKWIYSQ